jgi:hypothetical protein
MGPERVGGGPQAILACYFDEMGSPVREDQLIRDVVTSEATGRVGGSPAPAHSFDAGEVNRATLDRMK